MEIRSLRIGEIKADFEVYAYRDDLDDKTVKRYQQIIDDLPPVDVFNTDEGLILVGGYHRLEAHRQEGRETITATIHLGTVVEAKMFACKANAQHGLNMTASERKRSRRDFIKFNLERDPLMSNVEIAQAYGGCNTSTIQRDRKVLEADGEVETTTQRKGADGRIINTSSIGESTCANAQVDHTSHLTPHPVNEIFPFDKTVYRQIKESLPSMGLLKPITLYEGKILDGKIRYQACIDAGVKPEYKTFPDDFPHYRGDALDFAISSNLIRLHHTKENGLRMSLPIANITRDPDIHIREGTDPDFVSRYAEAMERGAKFPPVLVVFDNGKNWLVDGFHRLEAAESIGLDQFDVDLCHGDYETALYLACTVNATHGLPDWKRRVKQQRKIGIEPTEADQEGQLIMDGLLEEGVVQDGEAESR